MFGHILVAVDRTPLSLKAFNNAVAIARRSGARLTALHVIYGFPYVDAMISAYDAKLIEQWEHTTAAAARKLFATLLNRARKAGVKCDVRTVTADRVADAIIDVARRRRCNLIVMGSHGRQGIEKLLLGSEAHKVLTHSDRPVLIVR
jgi:nucleotide-binding universal stress UspA family protein